MAQRPRVPVLASVNTDIAVPVPHLPAPGETVLAVAAATFGAGGKGANQAVAAARLGAAVRMAGCCGDDEFGARLRAGLVAEGVDVTGLRAIPGAVSGLALITVDPAGENSIAVAPGANGLAGAAEGAAAFAPARAVLCLSAESPARGLTAALRQAGAGRVRTVLNLAPVPGEAAALLAEGPEWLVVNAQEAAAVARPPVDDVPDGPARAQALTASLAAGPAGGQVVVTLGAAGAGVGGPSGTAAGPGVAGTGGGSRGGGGGVGGGLRAPPARRPAPAPP